MKRIAIIAALIAAPAFAQDKPPSPAMIQGFTAALERQRNEAQNTVAHREGQLAEAAEAAKAKDAEIAELKKKCGEPCKPKEEPKK